MDFSRAYWAGNKACICLVLGSKVKLFLTALEQTFTSGKRAAETRFTSCKMKGIFVLVLLLVTSSSLGKKILLLPLMIKSHVLQLCSIRDGLLKNGHEVHIVVHSGLKVPSNILKSGMKIIRYKTSEEELKLDTVEFQKGLAEEGTSTKLLNLFNIFQTDSENMVDNPDLIEKLRKEKFDFAVVDGSAGIFTCLYTIPYRLGIEHASYSSSMPFNTLAMSLQVPFLSPSQLDPTFSMVSTFWQRLKFILYVNMLSAVVKCDERRLKATCETPFESIHDLIMKTHVWLIDLDSLVDVPKHLAPNMILVGGISTRPPLPLEEEFKVFADSATEGLVVITFGGTIGFLPVDYVNRIVQAVEKVKYKVVFRQLTKPTVKVPANLKIVDWVPQNDLLAHPNTKVFVTHCGSNGQHEAVYHGVPMLGLPVIGDQIYNAARLTAKGYGRHLILATVSPEELAAAIEDIATNPKYRTNIQKASKIFKSRPMAPRERAAYWIEHVMEHGSDHLQAYTNQLAWYQILLLDVMAFILVVVLLVCFIIYKCVRFICRRCTSTSRKEKVN
ncbi:UDP-glucuronosyltransferase 2C1-like isoform X2 [Lineus longissimus]|uniref:UDP-glucuronosyltransferase 2C1-like isoform X2 n=2 Tax=Lineus longissimus TaxID=88925 RepID=UPI00315D8F6E